MEVRAILHAHTRDRVKVPVLARQFGVHPNAIYNIVWGKTHREITHGRNVSVAPARKADLRERIRTLKAAGCNKSEIARELGVSRPTVSYHLNKDEA
ncbi:helix-turn-helix domain-containing protein [Nocardia africana]